MDWTGLLRDAWRITRRTSALWGLGTISALQAGVYTLIIAGLIAPMTAFTQILVQMSSAPATLGTGSGAEALRTMVPGAISWIQRWEPILLAGIIGIVALWAFLGVFDVAATGGVISQTAAVVEGREATARAGLRDGFRVWWRTVGLLAIAALPSLLYLLVVAMFTLFTISIPLRMGTAPNLGAIRAGDVFNGILSTVVGLVGIPLGVVVTLGLRYAVLENQEWRASFSAAWKLAGQNLSDVALMFVLQLGINLGATLVLSLAMGVVLAVAGILVAVLVGAAHTFSGAAMFVTLIVVILATALVLAYSVALIVWFSVVWTLFWRRVTGRDPRRKVPAPMYAAPAYAYPADVAGVSAPAPQEPSRMPQAGSAVQDPTVRTTPL